MKFFEQRGVSAVEDGGEDGTIVEDKEKEAKRIRKLLHETPDEDWEKREELKRKLEELNPRGVL